MGGCGEVGSQGPLKAKPGLLSSDQHLSYGVWTRPPNLCRKPERTPSLLCTKPLTFYILTSNSNSMKERKKRKKRREGGRQGEREERRGEERGRRPLRLLHPHSGLARHCQRAASTLTVSCPANRASVLSTRTEDSQVRPSLQRQLRF